MRRIAVIGAGLSGLTLATQLQDVAKVAVFEKSRGVGGRMSTRRAEPYFFDHGAQYFTARSKSVQRFLAPLIENKIVQRWDAKYAQFDGTRNVLSADWGTDEPRYVAVPGMNAMAKHLVAQGLHVELGTRVTGLVRQSSGWELLFEDGSKHGTFDWVLMSVPAPQAAELLPENFRYVAHVRQSEMIGCFALMIGLSKPVSADFDAAHVSNSILSWMALNSSKPGRSKFGSVLLHSSPEFAQKHEDSCRETVSSELLAAAEELIDLPQESVAHTALHFWKYANNASRDPQPVLIDYDLGLAACGDWCEGGRVEGAFVSAFKLSEVLRSNSTG